MYIQKFKLDLLRNYCADLNQTLYENFQVQVNEPPWEGGTKVYINGPGHMTKMAAMPIYGKNLKKLLLQNHKSYDLETWHVASGTQALQSLYK